MPAALMTSAGIVTWFLRETALMTLYRISER
jgi:hypothetical protein